MPLTTRTLVPFFLILMCGACQTPAPFKVKDRAAKSDAPATFDPPNSYPGWASDAPQYQKPVQELTPEPKAQPGDPLHYFTKEKVVMIRQPAGYSPEEIPRVAIWWTDNNGFHWHKAGYFGREQSSFPFEVEEDGDYGVRFVGPGQEQAAQAPAYPERVYHVDTTLPLIQVTVEPDQAWYNVGQTVTLSWQATDYHLIENPVNITALLDFTADESKPIEIQKGLPRDGSLTYQIPAETLEHEIRFRVDALDRADNLGIAYSHALQVVPEPIEQPKPPPRQDQAARLERARNLAEKPAGGFEKVAQAPPAQESINDEIAEPPGSSRKSFATVAARGSAMPDLLPIELDPEPALNAPSDYTAPQESAADVSEAALALHDGPLHDLTHGNCLLIPMPATAAGEAVNQDAALARPWRILAKVVETPLRAVWSLPRTRFMEMNPLLRALMADQSTRPVAEPPGNDSRFVGLPADRAE